MRIHVNFATTDLARSVDFYSVLLNARPKKVFADYALFVADRPAIELALDLVDSVPNIGNDHFGIFVETAGDVEVAARRLEEAGIVFSIEREETCCYAHQTKLWASDPMGRRWEVYTVHEEMDERDGALGTCCGVTDANATCCGT